MQPTVSFSRRPGPRAASRRENDGGGGVWRQLLLGILLLLLAVLPLRAASLDLRDVKAVRTEEGVHLSFTSDFVLPRAVEEALQKGVPIYFMAEARLYRPRWYWRDDRVAKAVRHWRLSYQPLIRRYRVNFGNLGQNYETLAEALAAIHRTIGWKIAEPDRIEEGERYYVELEYRLDPSQLPRPLQIGIDGHVDWKFEAYETVRLEDAPR